MQAVHEAQTVMLMLCQEQVYICLLIAEAIELNNNLVRTISVSWAALSRPLELMVGAPCTGMPFTQRVAAPYQCRKLVNTQ